MWLSGLHIPESYVTALVQTTCRLKNWPLDKSTLYTVVTRYTEPEQVNEELICFRELRPPPPPSRSLS